MNIFIDYSQQYNNGQKSTIQSTYRPSTMATQTSAPQQQQQHHQQQQHQPQQQHRETYVKQQDQNIYQRPQQTQAYNPEYDEGLIAQVCFVYIYIFKLLLWFRFHG